MGCTNPQYYGFQYDFLDRMTIATSAEFDLTTQGFVNYNRYNEQGITNAQNVNQGIGYDLRGNFTQMTRRGQLSAGTFGDMDVLAYSYAPTSKNRVSSITETGTFVKGFKSKTTTGIGTYTYDTNGNMTRDNHKKMGITYYYHNMPKKITFDDGNTIEWLYDASGNKLTKKTHVNAATTDNLTYYLGGIEYVGTMTGTTTTFTLDAVYHNEGRCANFTYNTNNAVNGCRYEYNLRDHLGNTRVTFAAANATSTTVTTTDILQQNHYYPFGANIEGLTSATTPNDYQYNGKEWNGDFGLDWNDYGARMYDAWGSRWWVVDPMAEIDVSSGTYNYCFDNPLRYIDPNGMSGLNPQAQAQADYDNARRSEYAAEAARQAFSRLDMWQEQKWNDKQSSLGRFDVPVSTIAGNKGEMGEHSGAKDDLKFGGPPYYYNGEKYDDASSLYYAILYDKASEQLGIKDLWALGGWVAGLPLFGKRFVMDGSSKGTSLLRLTVGKIPGKTPFLIWSPTFANPFSTAATWGKVVSRWTPWAAGGMLVYDAYKIYVNTNEVFEQVINN